ncbi:MAG: hypothetical protein OXH68_08185 [Gammaproteobacteria bacterium]|nr:hypothetical protein [Gammaproteobacteria bacterium]
MHETVETIRLTDDAEYYARDGYLVVPDLTSRTELADLEVAPPIVVASTTP